MSYYYRFGIHWRHKVFGRRRFFIISVGAKHFPPSFLCSFLSHSLPSMPLLRCETVPSKTFWERSELLSHPAVSQQICGQNACVMHIQFKKVSVKWRQPLWIHFIGGGGSIYYSNCMWNRSRSVLKRNGIIWCDCARIFSSWKAQIVFAKITVRPDVAYCYRRSGVVVCLCPCVCAL